MTKRAVDIEHNDQIHIANLGVSTRRSFVIGTSAAAAALALSACSDSTGPKGDTAAAGDVVGKASDVKVGGGKIFPKAGIVVTQPTEGEFLGLSAICTHQSCTLREVAKDKIICGCHGSEFSLTGEVLKGPATQPLPKKDVKVEGDEIVVA